MREVKAGALRYRTLHNVVVHDETVADVGDHAVNNIESVTAIGAYSQFVMLVDGQVHGCQIPLAT